MSAVTETAFRFALAALLTEPAGVLPAAVRADITAHLHRKDAEGNTMCFAGPEREALLARVRAWADAKGGEVGSTVRKALGETSTMTPPGTVEVPGGPPLPREESRMSFADILPDLPPVYNGADTQESTSMTELYGDSELQELHRQREYMEVAPFNTPSLKLSKALTAVQGGKVRLATDADQTWKVSGSKGDPYVVTGEGCSCYTGEHSKRTRFACYHAVAVELYQRWLKALDPSLPLPLPPTTVAERLAHASSVPTPAPPAPLPPPPEASTMPQEPVAPPQPSLILPQTLTLPLRSISAIVTDLSKPLPSGCLGVIPASAKRPAQPFLHWQTVAAVLDTYAPGWQGTVRRIEKVGEKWAVTYRLTIPTCDGPCSQEDIGMEDESKDDYGDAMTNALATALKRAAAKFGLGRWLYDKDQTAVALAQHLKQERAHALQELGQLLETLGTEKAPTIAWLKAQTGVQRNDEIPLGAIRTLVGYLRTGAIDECHTVA